MNRKKLVYLVHLPAISAMKTSKRDLKKAKRMDTLKIPPSLSQFIFFISSFSRKLYLFGSYIYYIYIAVVVSAISPPVKHCYSPIRKIWSSLLTCVLVAEVCISFRIVIKMSLVFLCLGGVLMSCYMRNVKLHRLTEEDFAQFWCIDWQENNETNSPLKSTKYRHLHVWLWP